MRLTALEKEMLARAAEFVLAGEWPWPEGNVAKEAAALQRAADKMQGAYQRPAIGNGKGVA